MGFNYEIKYRPGKTNAVADSLSRLTDRPLLAAIIECDGASQPQFDIWEEIKQANSEEPYIIKITFLSKNKKKTKKALLLSKLITFISYKKKKKK